MLVRFAGPRLEKGGDDLLPVPLRLGGRTLGGALSWATPQPLAPFGDDSLFAGLTPPRRGAGQQAGAGRPGGARPRGQGVGAPEGRHAAGHGRQARRRPADLLPRHRQLGLVEPAAVGPVRGDAAPHRQPRRHGRRRRGAGRRRQGHRVGRPGRGRGAGAAAGARRLRPAQEPAADDAGHRRRQDRRRASPTPRTRPATTALPARRARST